MDTPDTPARLALLRFIDEMRAAYPDWRPRDLIANFRRAIPGYAEGVWTASMPFNSGPSDLPVDARKRLARLLRDDCAESGIDLGHVLVCLDLALNPDLIDDAFASWAGDLGLHALTNFVDGTDIPVALPGSGTHACLSDLLADLDGVVLANRVDVDDPLAAIFAYYAPSPPDEPAAPHWSRRFELFLRDLDLLDDAGEVRPDAAAPEGVIAHHVRRYVYWEELKNHLARARLDRMVRLTADRDFAANSALAAAIQRAVDQFVAFLRDGLARERAARLSQAGE